ncbi:MAG: DUF3035 domain-containing protein [Parvibaculales bacterium]
MSHHKKTLKNFVLMSAGAVMLTACGDDISDTFGYGKNAPDEFAVVTKAPLILPPDYSLRPPTTTGEVRDIRAPREQAREILSGAQTSAGTTVSAGEQMLLAKADATSSSNDIREQIETDGKTTIRKETTFVENLLFGEELPKSQIINPEAEAKRLEENKKQGKKPNQGESELISGEWSTLDANLGE